MKHNKILRQWLEFIGGFLAVYILVYVMLSAGGSYRVSEVSTTHVDYGWFPYGFYPKEHDELRPVKAVIVAIYIPLWDLDGKCVHNHPPASIYRK